MFGFGWAKLAGLALSAVNKVLDVIGWGQRRAERNEYREEGARDQKLADAEQAIKVKDSQLDIAAKPDATREELLKKARGRKRPDQ